MLYFLIWVALVGWAALVTWGNVGATPFVQKAAWLAVIVDTITMVLRFSESKEQKK